MSPGVRKIKLLKKKSEGRGKQKKLDLPLKKKLEGWQKKKNNALPLNKELYLKHRRLLQKRKQDDSSKQKVPREDEMRCKR